jgi:hypothetical protein
VTFRFWGILKIASDVTLVELFFLNILNFVHSFVECKVSVADGILMKREIGSLDFGIPKLWMPVVSFFEAHVGQCASAGSEEGTPK